MRNHIALLAFTTALAVAPLRAQSSASVPDGARVRVTAPVLPQRIFGNVLAHQQRDELVVSTYKDDARVILPVTAVQRIEVSRGRPRLLGAAIGAGAGLLVGGLVGGITAPDDPEGFASLVGMIGGAGAGFTAGAVLGFAFAPERWSTVQNTRAITDHSVRVQINDEARVRRHPDGRVEVRGEPNRRAGVVRGAAVLGGIGLIFGGIDVANDKISGSDYAVGVLGNVVIGGLLGYLISPRGWQPLAL